MDPVPGKREIDGLARPRVIPPGGFGVTQKICFVFNLNMAGPNSVGRQSRLKAVVPDPLEDVGLPSKGDKT